MANAYALMGVERMAGSNPEFGMAEPTEWIRHDHADMKHLNCIFTRVHWPQDKRVLDYCDRHGILMQTEDLRPHLWKFFQAVRSRKPVLQDAVFGHNAALGCHLANESYYRKSPVYWDPVSQSIMS